MVKLLGFGVLEVVCNVTYAAMRAKDTHPILRKFTFVGGFPLTLISFTFVKKGSHICYGHKLEKD